MPTRKSTADKLKKPLLCIFVFLFFLSGTLYYYFKGETDAPGYRSRVDDYDVHGMEVHFIDVGQGDCTLLLCGESAVLVDGGEYEYGHDVVNYLKHHGVEKLDLLVATHMHSDHIGGLIVVLEKMVVDEVLVNDSSSQNTDSQSEYDFTSALMQNGAVCTTAQADTVFSFDGMQLCVLQCENQSSDENEQSVVLRADYENTSVLLTGDIGEDTEMNLVQSGLSLDCDIFKAAHHGSNYSNTYTFLECVTPDITVISCGENNRYNHPGDEALNRLLQTDASVYRTDVMGTVAFACFNNTIEEITY